MKRKIASNLKNWNLELITKARMVLRGEHMKSSDLKKLCAGLEINDQFAYAIEIQLLKMKISFICWGYLLLFNPL
jgi:hypothetical protein